MSFTETVEYYYTDHLGSRTTIFDDSSVKETITYDVWGKSSSKNACFTGKNLDSTGLYYFNARYYDPEMGKFLTEDPAKQGESWYTYCSNNPINMVDPDGNDPWMAHGYDPMRDEEEQEFFDFLIDTGLSNEDASYLSDSARQINLDISRGNWHKYGSDLLLEYGTDKEIAENIWKFDDLSFFEKSWISLTHSPFGMPGIGGASPATVYNLEGNLVPYGSSIQGRAEATGYMMGAAMVFSAAVALYTLDKMEYIINKPFNDFLADIEMQRQRLSALSNAWEQRGWITAEKASLIYEKLSRAHELGLKPATDGDWINQAKWMSTYATKYTDRFGKVWDFDLLLPPDGWELMLKTFGQIR